MGDEKKEAKSFNKFFPELIGLSEFYSKRLYLQELCNKYGDFKIASSWKDDNGEIAFSKHMSVLDCWQTENEMYRLDRATHRTPLPCEVFLDIDKDATELNLISICQYLREHYQFQYKAYASGGKGYHVHVFIPEMVYKSYGFTQQQLARTLRESIISRFNTDMMKKSEYAMIALEGCPHWRTGNPKRLLFQWGGTNV